MSRPLILISILMLLFAVPVAAQTHEWSFVAGSTSDSGCFFSWDPFTETWTIGEEFSLLPGGNYPYDAVMHPLKDEIWVCGASGDAVVIVDPEVGDVTATIPVGDYPVSLAFNVVDGIALVSCRSSDRVDVIDLDSQTVIRSIDIPSNYLGPGQIVFDIDGKRFFLAEWYDDTVYVIDRYGTEIVDSAVVGDSLWQVALDPYANNVLYVADRGTDSLLELDPETLAVLHSQPVGDDPWGLSCKFNVLAVCSEDSGELHYRYWDSMPGDPLSSITLPAGSDPRDLDIYVAVAIVDGYGRWPIMDSIYITGGATSAGSPVYIFDFHDEVISHTLLMPVTNTNVVAVDPQWPVTSGVGDEIPRHVLAAKVAPNPFNPATEISFNLPEAGETRVIVHDLAGRQMRTVFSGDLAAGMHTVTWNGCDDSGRSLPSGTYLVRVESGVLLATVKATLVE